MTRVQRRDWLRVGRSLLSAGYWRGQCTVDPGYRWYLERVRAAVDAVRMECGTEQARAFCTAACLPHSMACLSSARVLSAVSMACRLHWAVRRHSAGGQQPKETPCLRDMRRGAAGMRAQVHLVGHSAGGWLGRAFVADPRYCDSPAQDPGVPHPGVASLVTLGTPHVPPCLATGRDMTGGALSWVHRHWPGEVNQTWQGLVRSRRPLKHARQQQRWLHAWTALQEAGHASIGAGAEAAGPCHCGV